MKSRKETPEMRAALNKAREISRSEQPADWTEAEWKNLMSGIVAQKIEGKSLSWPLKQGSALAYGIVLAVVIAVIGFVLWDTVLKPKGGPYAPAPVLVRKPAPTPPLAPEGIQDKKNDTEAVASENPAVIARAPKPGRPKTRPHEPAAALKEGSQDVVSVTLVSQETGLQIVWFLDKNFEWKGDSR